MNSLLLNNRRQRLARPCRCAYLDNSCASSVSGGRHHAHSHAELIRSLSTAFFDAYLNDDFEARAWIKRFFAGRHPDYEPEFKPGKP